MIRRSACRVFGVAVVVWVIAAGTAARGQALPGTVSLPESADLSGSMLAGLHVLAGRLTARSTAGRRPSREKLAAAIGIVDERLPAPQLELVGDTTAPALLRETDRCRVFRVRWPVFDGVFGEGVHVQPKGTPVARAIIVPDAGVPPERAVDPRLLAAGCEIVVATLVDRGTEHSATDRLGIRTNVPHREWIYRQSYSLGRHIIGYEVQKTLSLVDHFAARPDKLPLVVAGVGEGGMLALYAAALDERIDGCLCAGSFGPREEVWREPLDRNVHGLLVDSGDAEVAALVAPRPLVVVHDGYPERVVSMGAAEGVQAIAAPTRRAFEAEVARARSIAAASRILAAAADTAPEAILRHLLPGPAAEEVVRALAPVPADAAATALPVDRGRQRRLVRDLERFSQQLIVAAEAERDGRFWKTLPMVRRADFEARVASERERMWSDVFGRLPDPDVPPNPRSRLVRETATVAIHEITLDVWDGVFPWGWLCLPKDLAAGERRPVVVCQHGLEGLPADTVDADESSPAWKAYKAFALRLAERGYVTFAPHHPYRGGDTFRSLQRKLNPLGLTLFSVIFGQHQRILEWLRAQPFVEPDAIAFYGLSYGGKSAMRIPAVLTGYRASICSGDFNEWIRYCVSTNLPIRGYVHAGEYEIWDWGLARHFNYAEMAALIAPRPFMVERGHDDGCGTDSLVDYEYAKVRRLYDKLGIGDRTTIEHFDGPHTIHGVGTFEFLERHLGPPR
jgi:cephalosporin-C deacetylase-like acetyl esterase